MKYFDAHCHVQFDPYDLDRAAVIASMQEKQVGGMVVGVDLDSSVKALKLVENLPNFYASAGLHPNYVLDERFDEDSFRAILRHPKMKAVGECGLDNFRPEDVETAKIEQRKVFEKHIELAIEADKPMMIHSRPSKGTQDAYRDMIDILRTYKREYGDRLRGDIHFFVGSTEEARDFLDLGFTMSFTAVLTFARDYDEVVRFLPLTSIITETDSPYVAPSRIRGQRNDPVSVIDVVQSIAEIRGEDEKVVREAVLMNARTLFSV
ncbi:MAG: TatD DNase family protein [Patescibacteria group bacterium]|nr:TatD DNase family protein [Patescibacteria group bacterium]